MKLTVFVVLAIALCAHAVDVKEDKTKDVKKTEKQEDNMAKDKRQTFDEAQAGDVYYRTPKKQEPVAPVEEPNNEDKNTYSGAQEEYRPGQVFSLNAQELLDLQPERKAPLPSSQQLQDLYGNPQQEHKQNLQQFYYLEPQVGRQQQVSLQPSHAVIARPSYTSNGGEASVGAALAVSDTGASPSDSFEQELYALLGQAPSREESRQQSFQAPQTYQAPQPQSYQPQTQSYQAVQAVQAPQLSQLQQVQPTTQSIAAQYQQIDRYLTKPSKKLTKINPKVISQIAPQSSVAPQQYLIETTNVQQQQQNQQQQIQQQQIQQQQIQQQQIQQQYRQSPQPQRAVQLLRYFPIQPTQQVQQVVYESPEPQGIKVVPAPKLTQPTPEFKLTRVQPAQPQFRYQLQYQQPEDSPKQYRLLDSPRSSLRQEPRLSSPSNERPVTYLKQYPDLEKQRAVSIYEQTVGSEGPSAQQPTQQVFGEQQYYLRPMYRINDQRARYEYSSVPLRALEQTKAVEPTKPPASSIYVSKNIAPKKVQIRPPFPVKPQPIQQSIPQEQLRETYRLDQQANYERDYEQSRQYAEQRAHLPPPKNNKAYTPEEFAALVAAGYSVTPIPVGSIPQSRSSADPTPEAFGPQRRNLPSRRNQYLPLRSDEAP